MQNESTAPNTLGKWQFTRDGKLEEVPVERWAWGVVYKDGREFHQFDKDGVFHQIKEIEQEHVKLWTLYKVGPENKRIDIVLPEGAKIIHKYKRYGDFNKDGSQDKAGEITVYVFGYKTGDRCFYNYILPDDRIVQSSEEEQLTNFGLK